VFAAARDVTELQRIQEALKKSHDELELRIKERTAELQKRKEQLETANRELESFSYSISHDLRAPLRAIDGYAHMILKKQGNSFDPETMRKFNIIRSSAHMMGQLINDILALSRVVKTHFSISELYMDAVIMEAWQEIVTLNPEIKMELKMKHILSAHGDRNLIKQVYFNLLANAAKFAKDRNPALIEAGSYIEGSEMVYYIKDNGVGFDMTYYDKLFGVFQRLHSSDDFEGTGVGLAIVKRIIQRHGGRVWAEAKVDEGATFYFTLPGKK
jgi:light-regulated signal transduction histidine kinase (bacteriophytochrome)